MGRIIGREAGGNRGRCELLRSGRSGRVDEISRARATTLTFWMIHCDVCVCDCTCVCVCAKANEYIAFVPYILFAQAFEGGLSRDSFVCTRVVGGGVGRRGFRARNVFAKPSPYPAIHPGFSPVSPAREMEEDGRLDH